MPRAKIWGFCISVFLSLLGLLPLAITQATRDVSSASSSASIAQLPSTNTDQNANAATLPGTTAQPSAAKLEKKINYWALSVHLGIAWTIVLGIVALGIFLSEADKLNEKWTDKADLALKGAGGLVIIVLTYWIGMISENRATEEKAARDRVEAIAKKESERKEKEQKDAETSRNNASYQAEEKRRQAEESRRQGEESRRKAERAEFIVRNLGESDETVRLAAIAVAGESLQEDSLYSLTMLQVLFSIVRSPGPKNKVLRDAALAFLPPLKDSSIAAHHDVVGAILDSYKNIDEVVFRKKLQDGGSTAVERARLALGAIGSATTSADRRKQSNEQTQKLLAVAVEFAKGAGSQTIQQLAPSLILAASSTNPDISGTKRDEAQKLVSTLSPEILENAVQHLPSTFLVYVHFWGEGQRLLAIHFQEELRKRGFVVPGIQDVSGKALVPEDNEVRRFLEGDKDTVEASTRVLEILRSLDNDKSRPIYVRPTSDNERKKGHLEVWFSDQYREPAWPGYSGWIVAGHYSGGSWTKSFIELAPTETPDSLIAKSATPDGLASKTTGKHYLYPGPSKDDAKKIGGLDIGQDVLIREIRPVADIIYARIEVVSKPKQKP